MFGLFSNNTCPVQPAEKQWIENGMLWYRAMLGDEFLSQIHILFPSEIVNPEREGSEEYAKEIFSSLCKHLGIDTNIVELQFFTDDYVERPQGFTEEATPMPTSRYEETNSANGVKHVIYLNTVLLQSRGIVLYKYGGMCWILRRAYLRPLFWQVILLVKGLK